MLASVLERGIHTSGRAAYSGQPVSCAKLRSTLHHCLPSSHHISLNNVRPKFGPHTRHVENETCGLDFVIVMAEENEQWQNCLQTMMMQRRRKHRHLQQRENHVALIEPNGCSQRPVTCGMRQNKFSRKPVTPNR
jgi:hypothetical protein